MPHPILRATPLDDEVGDTRAARELCLCQVCIELISSGVHGGVGDAGNKWATSIQSCEER